MRAKKTRDVQSRRRFNAQEIQSHWQSLDEAYRIRQQATSARVEAVKGNAAAFFREICRLKPFGYQLELAKLYRENQFLAVRWPRQTGKSTSIGALLLQDAYENGDLSVAFIGPSFRQTKLNLRRVAGFCRNLPQGSCHVQKTRISLKNGSFIEAFPNNPDTIRGNTFNCLPGYVPVLLSDGSQVPLSGVKLGQEVLSYNISKQRLEAKKVTHVFRNPLGTRHIVRIFHDYGYIDCTEDHKIFTLEAGYTEASHLSEQYKGLYLDIAKDDFDPKNAKENHEATVCNSTVRFAEATNIRQSARRLIFNKAKGQAEECAPSCKPLLRPSRIRSIQVLNPQKSCQDPTKSNAQPGLGKEYHEIYDSKPPLTNRDLSYMLPQRSKDYYKRLAFPNQLPNCFSRLVPRRWHSVQRESNVNKFSRIHFRRAPSSQKLAQTEVESKRKNKEGFAWKGSRLLLSVLGGGSRSLYGFNQGICGSQHEIQAPAKNGSDIVFHLWQTCPSEQNCNDERMARCLLLSSLQTKVEAAKPRLGPERTKKMRSLRFHIHAHSGQRENMFVKLQETPIASVEKDLSLKEQNSFRNSAMRRMLQRFHASTRKSKSLQQPMQKNQTQQVWKSPVLSKTLLTVQSDFLSSHSKAEILQSELQEKMGLQEKEADVYDIEVEDNHNFFANGLLVSNCIWWDEVNFTSSDEDLYDAILFTLGTTNGKLVASSTPFNSDSLFWRMCNHKRFANYARHHFSYEVALEPNGPLNVQMIERIKEQFGDDPARWRREMEAEWAEDEDVWLQQSLIVSCIGTKKNCGQDLEEYDTEKSCSGDFFLGLDIGQVRDYTSLSVVERVDDTIFLRHQKLFPHPTTHAHVLGYIKRLQDLWGGFEKIRVDFTREGPSLIKDMENAGIENAEGVNFSVPRKSEMASLLKQRMQNQQFRFPLLSWEKPYRSDICSELNVEKYQLRKDGNIGFSHPNGTHDDMFWSLALAVYATVEMQPEPYLAVIPR